MEKPVAPGNMEAIENDKYTLGIVCFALVFGMTFIFIVLDIESKGFSWGKVLPLLIYTPFIGGVGTYVLYQMAVGIVTAFHPTWSQVEAYKKKLKEYEKYLLMQKRTEWLSLSGRDFEFAVADLLEDLGYKVQVGAGANDQGVDIHLEKDGKKIVVQCKNHKNPVGPAVARELWGAFHTHHANEAWLVASSGWTKGVAEFAHFKKNFKLLNVDDLIKLNEEK